MNQSPVRPVSVAVSGGRWIVVVGLLFLGLATGARADAVRLGELPWLENVNVVEIKDGQIHYLAPDGSDAYRPLASVTGLRLNSLPELTQAEDLLARKKDLAKALSLFKQARGKTVKAWAGPWISARLMVAANEAGDPGEAVAAVVALARAGADKFYFTQLPTKALAKVKDEDRPRFLAELDNALRTAKGEPAKDALKKVRAALEGVATETPAAAPTVPTPSTPAGATATPAPKPEAGAPGRSARAGNGGTPTPALPVGKSVVPLAKALPANDPITQLLIQGQFDAALTEVDKMILAGATDLYLRLYQKGIAQEYLALKDKDKPDLNLLKSAGLSFMRVAIHFPRNNLAAPSLIEAAAVHLAIDRKDIAKTLLKRAAEQLHEEDLTLRARLEELQKQAQAEPAPENPR